MASHPLAEAFWRLNRSVWGYRLGRLLFFQPAVDRAGRPVRLRPILGRLNQLLMERGASPPWIMTPEECESYWRSRDNLSTGNPPRLFAQKDTGVILFLHRFWTPEVSLDDQLLELGPNCGANLEGLRRLGYRRLGGVDINPNALEEMKRSFPELAKTASILLQPIDQYLRSAPSRCVDIVFTMAVAHHVHPTLNDVFRHMARIARRYVCVIETEVANCTYQFARDFRRVFRQLGCREIRSAVPNDSRLTSDYGGYVARLFAVPASP